MLGIALAAPAPAAAHGPLNPVASDYQARVTAAPTGLQVRVVDGDQALWVSAPARTTVIVLDPRGAPYLRFSPGGIAVNTSSELYYLNQSPVAQPPPPGLSRRTPAHWRSVSSGHGYTWHEGRLHAPAALARPASGGYAGAFSIPLRVDGAAAAITGGVWYTAGPSVMWFWPIIVALACLLAVRRLRDEGLDRRAATALTVVVAAGITVATVARNLHGRPGLSAFSLAELALTLAIVGWGLRRVAQGRAGFMTSFALAFVALWEGITLMPALVHGYVLLALPAVLDRLAAVLCLAGGAGLLLASVRQSEAHPVQTGETDRDEDLDAVVDVG